MKKLTFTMTVHEGDDISGSDREAQTIEEANPDQGGQGPARQRPRRVPRTRPYGPQRTGTKREAAWSTTPEPRDEDHVVSA